MNDRITKIIAIARQKKAALKTSGKNKAANRDLLRGLEKFGRITHDLEALDMSNPHPTHTTPRDHKSVLDQIAQNDDLTRAIAMLTIAKNKITIVISCYEKRIGINEFGNIVLPCSVQTHEMRKFFGPSPNP